MDENKYIVALGYISTCVPEMIIDVENPLDMMRQVYDRFDQLRARVAELERVNRELSASFDRTIDREDKLIKRVSELEAENERLRKAINFIVKEWKAGTYSHEWFLKQEEVKAALEVDDDDTRR